jgi:hypothetical protein
MLTIHSLVIPASVDAALIVHRADGDHLVVSDAGNTWDLAPDGTILAQTAEGAVALGARDLDGDGLADLVVCGPNGFGWIPWSTGGLGGRVRIDAAACVALAPTAAGFAVGGPPVDQYVDQGAGLVLLDSYDVDLTGPAVLAGDGSTWAATAVGDDTLYVADPYGISGLAAGAGVTGLTAADGWVLGLDDGRVRRIGDPATAVGLTPGVLSAGDLDADALPDVVVAYPDDGMLGVLWGSGAAESRIAIPVGTDVLAAGDLDGDGCGDVVVADPAAAYVQIVSDQDCSGAIGTDADGDGFTVEGGDCDDAAADVYPGAWETCDERDEDCDGVADEVGDARIAGETAGNEGETVIVWAETSGCASAVDWTWGGVSVDFATCEAVGSELHCATTDDGVLSLTADASDGITHVAGDVTIANVDPVFAIPDLPGSDDLSNGELFLVLGEAVDEQLEAIDVPADPITWTTDGATPTGWTMSPGGFVSFEPTQTGIWDFELTAADDDGGLATMAVHVEISSGDTGGNGFDNGQTDCGGGGIDCGGGCCCVAAALPFGWGFARMLGMRRRR